MQSSRAEEPRPQRRTRILPPYRWRYYAVRALTGEVLHRDLPLAQVKVARSLGSSSIRGRIAPAIESDLVAGRHTDGMPKLYPWATWLVAENPAGRIVAAGPLTRTRRAGPVLHVEAAGVLAWLARQYWIGAAYSKVQADPLGIVRDLVAEAQSDADAQLGITVVGSVSSRLRVGEPEHEVTDDNGTRTVPARPFELNADEQPNIAQEIGELAGSEPGFDVIEDPVWADRDAVSVAWQLRLGYPRVGQRRHDLVLSTQWNLTGDGGELADGDGYANTVIGRGRGEGTQAPFEIATAPHDGVPRVMAVEDLHAANRPLLTALTRKLATARSHMTSVRTVTTRRVLAPDVAGDDTYIEIVGEWGRSGEWHRVLGLAWDVDAGTTIAELAPSGAFVYGRP